MTAQLTDERPGAPAASRSPCSAASYLLRAVGDAAGRTARPGCPGSRRSAGSSRCGRTPASAGGCSASPLAFAAALLAAGVRAGRPARPRRRPAARPARPADGRRRAAAARSRWPGGCSAASLLGWVAGFAVLRRGDRRRGRQRRATSLGGKRGRDLLDQARRPQRALVDAFLPTVMGILGAGRRGVRGAGRAAAARRGDARGAPSRCWPTGSGGCGWAASHVAFAVGRPGGRCWRSRASSIGLVHGLRATTWAAVPAGLLGALVQLPAVWVLAGITVALFGLVPRIAVAAWGVLGACLLLGQLGPLLELKQWVMDISPFTHVPKLPGAAMRHDAGRLAARGRGGPDRRRAGRLPPARRRLVVVGAVGRAHHAVRLVRRGDQAGQRPVQVLQLGEVNAETLDDRGRDPLRLGAQCRPSSVSVTAMNRSSSRARPRWMRPPASRRLRSGDRVPGSSRSRPLSSLTDRGECPQRASMTRYCGCVSPIGSSSGR